MQLYTLKMVLYLQCYNELFVIILLNHPKKKKIVVFTVEANQKLFSCMCVSVEGILAHTPLYWTLMCLSIPYNPLVV